MTSKKARTRKLPIELGQEIELRFHDLLSNGQAVGRADGVAVFVFGPLPGELARVRISAVKQKYAVGELKELLERSDARAQPFCPVFGTCGGCQIQHLTYAQQLKWKQSVVRNALQRIGGMSDVHVYETIGMSNPRAYRNKMSLVVDHPDGFGFYKQRSHDIVRIDRCPIVQPALDKCIGALIDLQNDSSSARAFANARHVVARTSVATGQNIIAIAAPQTAEERKQIAPRMLERLPNAAGIVESFDLSSENAILGQKMRTLAGSDSIEEVVGGIRFRISASSFFQVN
ncbi:MAG: 23S rRNA (uracil(1939)-C(5))-methyltransferase RlmD, partial [Candidatus Eremiobacteraeota bacterium]|nr:23S rRNA (uracil(1939)-C(5))-methyltransferase RlmD [Candidatus Eremiobacteraeota bacterium]